MASSSDFESVTKITESNVDISYTGAFNVNYGTVFYHTDYNTSAY